MVDLEEGGPVWSSLEFDGTVDTLAADDNIG